MRTQIIQSEPEPVGGPAPLEPPVDDERDPWVRRGIVFTAVAGYIVLGVVHPADIEVGDETTLYLWLHLLQPVLILLLAWGIWLLVKDLPGRAAQVARVAIVPFAIAYSIFDAIAGIATGIVVRGANGLTPAEGAAVQRVFDDADRVTEALSAGVYVAAGLAWFIMALAAAIALKQVGGLGPTLLMIIGAATFAVGHPFPPGPIGMALFGLGVAWLELRRREAPVADTQPVLAP